MVDDSLKLNKVSLIQSKEGRIEDYYSFNIASDVVGTGGFASVVKATTREGNQPRAIKILRKKRINDKAKFKEEIEILKNLDHPNIVKLYETFEDARHVYLITELCTGGEVFDKIISKGHFTEGEAKKLFAQMIRPIVYCHAQGICYRDLKPENFMYIDETPESDIKLIDFGLARSFYDTSEESKDKEKQIMTTRVGTAYYIAPEVLAGSYDETCDVWSAGVILYILLCGLPPFNGVTDGQIADKIREGKYSFEGKEWKDVSDSAKDLINKMLSPAASRLKASEVLVHPWLAEKDANDDKPLNVNYEGLKNFSNAQKLKRIAMMVIAAEMSEDEIKKLAHQFNKLDKNGDGVLTFEEMQAGVKELEGKAAEEIKAVMDSIDADKNGCINYSEFLAATMEQNLYMKENKLLQAFKVLDKDGNGKITADEIKAAIGDLDSTHGKDYYDTIIKEADLNGDGMIDYQEFLAMMNNTGK